MFDILSLRMRLRGAPVHIIDNEDPKRTPTITDDAIKFMRANVQTKKPLYVQLSYYVTHLYLCATREDIDEIPRKTGVLDHRYRQGWAGMMEVNAEMPTTALPRGRKAYEALLER